MRFLWPAPAKPQDCVIFFFWCKYSHNYFFIFGHVHKPGQFSLNGLQAVLQHDSLQFGSTFYKKNRLVKSKQCAFPIEKFPYNLTRWELGCKFSQFWKRLHRRGEKNIKKVLTCCQLLSKLLFQPSA